MLAVFLFFRPLMQKSARKIRSTTHAPPAAAPAMSPTLDLDPDVELALGLELPPLEDPVPVPVPVVPVPGELLPGEPDEFDDDKHELSLSSDNWTTWIGATPPFLPSESIIENATEVPAVKLTGFHEKEAPGGGWSVNDWPFGIKP